MVLPSVESRIWQQLLFRFLATKRPASKYLTYQGRSMSLLMDWQGLVQRQAGGFPEPEIIHYDPKEYDFGKKKAFPFRDQHFFASEEKAKHFLGWKPEFDPVECLADSCNLDFGRGTYRKEADFSTDDLILGKNLVQA